MSDTWLTREEKRKVTFTTGDNETKINVVLIRKEHQLFLRSVKAIPGEFLFGLEENKECSEKATYREKKDTFAEGIKDQETILGRSDWIS